MTIVATEGFGVLNCRTVTPKIIGICTASAKSFKKGDRGSLEPCFFQSDGPLAKFVTPGVQPSPESQSNSPVGVKAKTSVEFREGMLAEVVQLNCPTEFDIPH